MRKCIYFTVVMQPLKNFSIILIIMLVLSLQFADAKDSPSVINFDNRSGESALIKLVGPTSIVVNLANNQKKSVNVAVGEYYILVRYGESPERYRYTKGKTFTVSQTGTNYSVISITLHRVAGCDYPSGKSSKVKFDTAITTEIIAKRILFYVKKENEICYEQMSKSHKKSVNQYINNKIIIKSITTSYTPSILRYTNTGKCPEG